MLNTKKEKNTKDKIKTFSPMISQYLEIREKYKDGVILFRLGEFYELFFDDAIFLSKELGLTLTSKSCGGNNRAPMCGVPVQGLENFILRLLKVEKKIIICEQIENDSDEKNDKIFKREVTKIITPGTLLEDNLLKSNENNFLCSIVYREKKEDGFYQESIFENRNRCLVICEVFICFCDISTGILKLTSFKSEETFDKKIVPDVQNEIKLMMPSEVIVSSNLPNILKKKIKKMYSFEEYETENYNENLIKDEITQNNNLNISDKIDINVIAIILEHFKKININIIKKLDKITYYDKKDYMTYECSSFFNLEILENFQTKKSKGSLLDVIDNTSTCMGGRLLKNFLKYPLKNIEEINSRLDATEEILCDFQFLNETQQILKKICDIERIMNKIILKSSSSKDLISIMNSIKNFKILKKKLNTKQSSLLLEINKNISDLYEVYTLIKNSIDQNAALFTKDGEVIKKGFDEKLDEIRNEIYNVKKVILEFEDNEKKTTGINKLKLGYTRNFGYFIEISSSYKGEIPKNYARRQTLLGKERYVTQELKEFEINLMNAKERALKHENQIFENIINEVANEISKISKSANAIAYFDVLLSFAKTSLENNYNKPEIIKNGNINIKNARHPVIEKNNTAAFISNDCVFDEEKKIFIITGPNMSGKSTYMRSIALNVILAQIGCFIAADTNSQISIIDSIYTRIGASDNPYEGKSTFMVEMNEAAYIVNNAKKDSLLLIDELGRGTSNSEGLAIAFAVIKYLSGLGAKTFFSTHYHELSILEKEFKNIKNYFIKIKKNDNEILFLRKLLPGSTDKSYGIEIAELAGMPDFITNEAKKYLNSVAKFSTNFNRLLS